MKKALSFVTLSVFLCLSSFSLAFSAYKKVGEKIDIEISGEIIEHTGYFAYIFSSTGSFVSKTETVVNDDNDTELMIKDFSLEKGQSVKLHKEDGDVYYGTPTSYEHNLSVACSKNAGTVTDSGNYIAVQDGTYDFYFKFYENTYATYQSTYVKVDDVRTIYCEANWDDIKSDTLKAHYWGDNVIGSVWDYKPSMIYDHKNSFNKDVCKVVIPSKSSSIKFIYQKNGDGNPWIESSNQTLGTDNSYYFDQWNDGTPTMDHYNY